MVSLLGLELRWWSSISIFQLYFDGKNLCVFERMCVCTLLCITNDFHNFCTCFSKFRIELEPPAEMWDEFTIDWTFHNCFTNSLIQPSTFLFIQSRSYQFVRFFPIDKDTLGCIYWPQKNQTYNLVAFTTVSMLNAHNVISNATICDPNVYN